MIVDKVFLNKLKDFGLNSYEVKIWTALLSRGVSTAGELSDIANVPRSRSYDVLESLEKKGFIITKIGKPIKYLAVPPTEVVDRVKQRIKRDAEDKEKIIEEVRKDSLLGELDILFKQGIKSVDLMEITGCFRGRDSVYTQLNSMIKNAKKSIVLKTTKDGLARKGDALKITLEKAKDRGINIKIFAPLDEKNKEHSKKLSFTKLKHSDTDSRMCIVDGKETLLMLADDKDVHPDYDTAIWVNSEYLSSFLEKTINE